jgi:hypothetical protein
LLKMMKQLRGVVSLGRIVGCEVIKYIDCPALLTRQVHSRPVIPSPIPRWQSSFCIIISFQTVWVLIRYVTIRLPTIPRHMHPIKSEEERRVSRMDRYKKVVARSQPSTPDPGKIGNAIASKTNKQTRGIPSHLHSIYQYRFLQTP